MADILSVDFSFKELDDYIKNHFDNLDNKLKKQIWRKFAKYMRTKTAKDYKSGKNPDGTAFIPPKWQKRQMFYKLGKSSHLRMLDKGGFLQLGYFNTAGRIARVHHFGLVEKFTKGFLKGKRAKYPKRELLGVTKKDLKELELLILSALEP